MQIKNFIFVIALLLMSSAVKATQVTIGFLAFSELEASEVKALIPRAQQVCRNCDFKDLTPYTFDKKIDEEKLASFFNEKPSVDLLVFLDNPRLTQKNQVWQEVLKKWIAQGQLIVSSAGKKSESEVGTVSLSQTVFASIPGVIIIGELEGRDVLKKTSYFGPQMLTALRTQRSEFKNHPAFWWGAFWGQQLPSSKTPAEWEQMFTKNKLSTKTLWPQLELLFNRKN